MFYSKVDVRYMRKQVKVMCLFPIFLSYVLSQNRIQNEYRVE